MKLMCDTHAGELNIPSDLQERVNQRTMNDTCLSTVHVVTVGRSTAGKGLGRVLIAPALAYANEQFAGAGLEFVIDDYNYIDSDFFNSWNSIYFNTLLSQGHHFDDRLNFYIFDSTNKGFITWVCSWSWRRFRQALFLSRVTPHGTIWLAIDNDQELVTF